MSNFYIGTKVPKKIYIGTQSVKSIYLGTQKVWGFAPEPVNPELSQELCFTAKQAGSSVGLKRKGSVGISNTSYSFDRINWTSYTVGTSATEIPLANVGDKVYFRNTITANFSATKYLTFVIGGKVEASGNIMSMISHTNFENMQSASYAQCCRNMFDGCAGLTRAPVLPATSWSNNYFYAYMFRNCTSLTVAPELPATSLTGYCYQGMFYGCSNLVTAPILKATSVVSSNYSNMFNSCTKITNLYLGCSQSVGESAGAPWGATNATIHYNWS